MVKDGEREKGWSFEEDGGEEEYATDDDNDDDYTDADDNGDNKSCSGIAWRMTSVAKQAVVRSVGRAGIGSENEGNNKKWIKAEMERNRCTTTGGHYFLPTTTWPLKTSQGWRK